MSGFARNTGTSAGFMASASAMSFAMAGTPGNDTLTSGAPAETLEGGDGNDVLESTVSPGDVLEGGSGNDVLIGHAGAVYRGGGGVDRLEIDLSDQTADVSLNLEDQKSADITAGPGTTIQGFENFKILLGAGSDTVYASFDYSDYYNRLDQMYWAESRFDGGDGIDTFNIVRWLWNDVIAENFEVLVGDYSRISYKFDLSWSNPRFRYFDDESSDEGYGFSISGTFRSLIFTTGTAADSLSGGVERDILNGGGGNDRIDGNDGDDELIGNTGNDEISGGNGVDTLIGGSGNDRLEGGAGIDVYNGGSGNDIYVLGSDVGETITDSIGVDTIWSDITRSLAAYGTIENLTLSGSAAVNGTGNNLDNILRGNSAINTLTGGGGKDALYGGQGDKLVGGLGDDAYFVDSTGITIVERAGEGIDTVYTSVSFTLTDTIENLTVTAANVTATGNRFDNVITGSNAADNLNGVDGDDILKGQDGTDVLNGGAGNDSLDGGNYDDTLYGGSGNDSMAGGLSNDTLNGGSGNDTMAGNFGNDTLWGASGNDIMSGGVDNDILSGGLGNDRLTGGAGADTFIFDAALSATTNVDRIMDFAEEDTIRLENSVFKALIATGTLAPEAFIANNSGVALDSNDRIIYEIDTGNLYYDSNGKAAGGSVLFAKLGSHLPVTFMDFYVI